MRSKQLFISLTLGLGLTLVLLWLLGGATLPAAYAAPPQCPGQRALLLAGDVITVCLSGGCDYDSIQDAVDVAAPGDEILVATGTYTGVGARAGVTQVVYISKTVTIRGGYNADFSAWDPDTYSSTLNAQGQGRVLYITGSISPTIEGLRITGGDATGLGGGFWPWMDAGGGVYIISATAAISNSWLYSNTTAWDGGGLYLSYGTATLSGNTVTVNTANRYGGGLLLYFSDAKLISNTITANTSSSLGSGLLIGGGGAMLIDNVIAGNVSDDGSGGGLWVSGSDVTLTSNTITSNSARGNGGGLAMQGTNATLSGNTITDNFGRYSGGGISAYGSAITLSGNIIAANTTTATGTSPGDGGGLSLVESDVTLINNLIADNHAGGHGSGLYIQGSSLRLLHTTMARNSGGDGSGVYIIPPPPPLSPLPSPGSIVALTNTILVSHTVGITVTAGNTVTVNGLLWYGTPITISQAAMATVAVQNQHEGDPAFAADGYHLTGASAGIDKGVAAGVTTDIDGQSRDAIPDLGADEFVGVTPIYLPLLMRQYQ